ncbi:MAG: hypothetical protein DMF61_04235 [Blastocatellia bacterium AA13]|nr:MAG: hypothetical protein DMF61_04235 [Blastocatellia bacterium AA13]
MLSQAANRYSRKPSSGSRVLRSGAGSRSRNRKTRDYMDGLIAIVMIAAAAACVSFYLRTRSELETAQAKRSAQARKLERLQVETERVGNEIERLRSDPKFIELVARQRLGMIRQGDVIIRLDDRPDQSPKPARLTLENGSDYTANSN